MKSKYNNKKAQVRMSETVAILFIFFVLLLFGFVFYSKIEAKNIVSKASEIQDLKAIEVSQVFSYLPEISCSEDNVVTNNCIDLIKMEALSGTATTSGTIKSNPNYYYDKLLRSAIKVTEIYPNTTREWVVYNNTNFKWSKKVSTSVPISLYNATGNPQDKLGHTLEYYSFGVITVETYS